MTWGKAFHNLGVTTLKDLETVISPSCSCRSINIKNAYLIPHLFLLFIFTTFMQTTLTKATSIVPFELQEYAKLHHICLQTFGTIQDNLALAVNWHQHFTALYKNWKFIAITQLPLDCQMQYIKIIEWQRPNSICLTQHTEHFWNVLSPQTSENVHVEVIKWLTS